MQNKLDRIIEHIIDIKDDVSEIKRLDAVQNQQLAEHIRRTEIAEKRIDIIEERTQSLIALKFLKDNAKWIGPLVLTCSAIILKFTEVI